MDGPVPQDKVVATNEKITSTKSSSIRDTLLLAKVETPDEAIREIYKRLRPGDPPTREIAKSLFKNLFFNPKRYNLSIVGRMKLNQKFGLEIRKLFFDFKKSVFLIIYHSDKSQNKL